MAHWRNTYKPARFFFLDVRVGVVILASLIHVRLWTITLDLIVVLLAWYVERIGLGFMGAMRAAREWLAGPVRPALAAHKVRRKVDYGRRRMAWDAVPFRGDHHLTPIKETRPGQ